MKKITFSTMIIILLMIIMTHDSLCQKQNNHWYFGNKAAIDFVTDPPTELKNSKMIAIEGCSSISDSTGELLFYTNGVTIWNSLHEIMNEGSGLLGQLSAVQTGLSIQQPNNPHRYYVFSLPEVERGSNTCYYSVVDMRGDQGLGTVTEKNTILLNTTTEKITCARHENGIDYWIILHDKQNTYYSFLLDKNGISKTPIESNGQLYFNTSTWDCSGYMKTSIDSKKIAISKRGVGPQSWVELVNFDNKTGIVNSPTTIVFPSLTYGIEFSPNGQYMYVSCGTSSSVSSLYQVDIRQHGIDNKLPSTLLFQTDLLWYGALQIAINKKIYLAINESQYLGVINNPDGEGQQCDFVEKGLFLEHGRSFLGLPTIDQTLFFIKPTVKDCDISKGRQTTLPNSYYKVNSIFPDLGGVQLGTYNGLCPDDKVLIIQMQGAFINTDNTTDYGKIQSLVFSGNYEFARIASITSIGIIFKNKLKNFYSSADGNVQLIRVPEYRNLTINSPLSCQAWNGETGGVLVFSVENTLQLNSFIDVTGKGFRGGAASNAVNNPTMHTGDYVSAVDSTRFSRKGEGIFGWRNPDHRAGRGAAASGGGGGNNHNAGGGGGSYLGCGGMGGYGWDTYPGDRTITQGMGGYPIQLIGNKIFMGGGGGAGHSNEFTGTAGAAGGGIVIIQAKEIISNNQSIIAKGADGKNAPFDGTGGGGAGGTILLDCRRFVNRIELDVRGGSGGSTTEHRDGPGGGGGGGLIGFTAPETPTDVIPLVNGGGSGTNRDLNKDGATNGCPGAVLHNIALPGDITIIATMEESQADDSKSALPYPHPASETVHLSVISNEAITVSDVLGNVLDIPITRHSQGISIDVSMIHAGNYYIRVGNTYYSCVVIH